MEETSEIPSNGRLHPDSFLPEMMDGTVTGASLDHVQLSKGRFRADLLRAAFGESRLDWGEYNLPVPANGAMPDDAVTLGFILAADAIGNFNGFSMRAATPVLLTENAELHYRLAPGTQWAASDSLSGTRQGVPVPIPRALTARARKRILY